MIFNFLLSVNNTAQQLRRQHNSHNGVLVKWDTFSDDLYFLSIRHLWIDFCFVILSNNVNQAFASPPPFDISYYWICQIEIGMNLNMVKTCSLRSLITNLTCVLCMNKLDCYDYQTTASFYLSTFANRYYLGKRSRQGVCVCVIKRRFWFDERVCII